MLEVKLINFGTYCFCQCTDYQTKVSFFLITFFLQLSVPGAEKVLADDEIIFIVKAENVFLFFK